MRKNICLVIDRLDGGGGGERFVLSLAQAFSKCNCRVDIITSSDESSYPLDTFTFNVHFIRKMNRSILNIQNAKYLQNKITDIGVDFDLVISSLLHTDRICKKINMPNTYYCIHGALSIVIDSRANREIGFSNFRQKIYSHLIRKLYENQNIITVSDGVKQDLIKLGIQAKSMQVIYNPFDFDDIRQQSKAYPIEDQDYIIHVGRFGVEKRHDLLINAYKQSGIKQKLLLLGDGETIEQTKQLVANLKLQNQVIFKGFNPNPFPYIKNAKALVLSSDFEGFGMVLAEALILGVPIISTNALSGPREILIDELKAFLSPTGDVKALAKNIRKMINNPIKITSKYTDRFSAEESVKKYLALCD